MTRGEIKAQAGLVLREQLGTPGAGDPFALDMLVDNVADNVAKVTDCYWDSVTTDLVAGQALYCDSNLYKVKAAFVLDALGNWLPLRTTTPIHADQALGAAWWRNAPDYDPPRLAIFEGARQVRLFPVPSVSRTGALTLEGFMTPRGLWSDEGDECPLPAWAQTAIVYGVCKMRCVQFIGEVDGAAQKAQVWAQEYRHEVGDVEQKAANYAPRESLFLPGCFVGRVVPV